MTEVIDRAINWHKNMGGKEGKGAIRQRVQFLDKLKFKCLGDIQMEESSRQCIYSRFQDRNYKFGSHQHRGI